METPTTTKKSSKKAWIIITIISLILVGLYLKRSSFIPTETINTDSTAVVTTSVAPVLDTTKSNAKATATAGEDTVR